jgi:hypothetical protein
MKIIDVNNKKTIKDFLEVPRILYKYDKVWVCPLDREVEARFDTDKNIFLKEGDARRWILLDSTGTKLIGRIAAFYNLKKSQENDQPTGGIGFFECINDHGAARLLFDTAKSWLTSKGMEAMDGPVNLGENDSFWGCLVEGFTHPGYGMPYNFPYYENLFEEYGFKTYFEQFSYHLEVAKPFPERFWKIAEWVMKKPGYTFKHFTFKDQEKFIADMVEIYNTSWSNFKADYTPMNPDSLRETLNQARMIIDEEIVWFAYHNENPIAFFIMFPDVNQIIKPLKGKLSILNKLRFLYSVKTGKINRARALVAGIVPRFQNSGIESAIFSHYNKIIPPKKKYKEIELSWVGDYNPKMQALYNAVGAQKAKKHVTFRYLFDRKKPFRRFMPELFEKK